MLGLDLAMCDRPSFVFSKFYLQLQWRRDALVWSSGDEIRVAELVS